MLSLIPENIEQYCTTHSSSASVLADELNRYTHQHCEQAQMVTGRWEGALLRTLVGITGARRVLEIGLFTGYSALNMAEGLPDDGMVMSCELREENAEIAQSFLDRSPHGKKVTILLGPALESLQGLRAQPLFDLVFIDADKENYGAYFDASVDLLRPNGLIVADNVLWSGRVLDPKEASDRALAAFNDKVRKDSRVEVVMLPIRDGVSLIRKRA